MQIIIAITAIGLGIGAIFKFCENPWEVIGDILEVIADALDDID